MEFRTKDPRNSPYTGWWAASDPMLIMTTKMDPAELAVLLEGRFPRVHLRAPIEFAKMSDRITHGLDTLQ